MILSLFPSTFVAFFVPVFFFYEQTTLPEDIFIQYLVLRTITGLLSFFLVLDLTINSFKYRNLKLFSFSGLIFILAYILETISFFALNNSNTSYMKVSKVSFMVSQFCLTIAPFLLLYFIVRFFVENANFWGFLPMLIDVILESILQPMGLVLGKIDFVLYGTSVYLWIYDPIEFWINVFYYISIMWMVIYILYLIYSNNEGDIDNISREQQKIFIIGIVVVFVLSPLVFSSYIFIQNNFIRFLWVSVFGRSISILGLSLFVVSYSRSSKKLDYFQPQSLYSLYFFDYDTLLLKYQKKFKTETTDTIVNFLANNLKSLNSMISEVTGKNAQIQEINVVKYKLLVRKIENKSLLIILIVNHSSDAVESRYNRMINEIREKNENLYEDLPIIVESNFGA